MEYETGIEMGQRESCAERGEENGCDQKHPIWTNRLTTLFTTLVSTTLASRVTTGLATVLSNHVS